MENQSDINSKTESILSDLQDLIKYGPTYQNQFYLRLVKIKFIIDKDSVYVLKFIQNFIKNSKHLFETDDNETKISLNVSTSVTNENFTTEDKDKLVKELNNLISFLDMNTEMRFTIKCLLTKYKLDNDHNYTLERIIRLIEQNPFQKSK